MDKFDDLFSAIDAPEAPPAGAPETVVPAAPDNVGKFDDLFSAIDDSSGLHAALQEASTANPEQEAKKRKLAQGLNVPPALVPNMKDGESELFMKNHSAQDIQQKSPKVAEFLAKEGNALLAKNDIPNFQGIESVVSEFKNIGGAAMSGLLQTNVGAFGIARAVSDALPLPQGVSDFFAGQQQKATAVANYFGPDTGDMGSVRKGVYSGVSSVAAQTPAMIAAAPLALAGKLAQASHILLGFMSANTAGQEYGTAKDAGVDTARAVVHAAAQGGVEYLTELLPTMAVFKGLTGKTGLLKTATNFFMAEVPGEELATAWQDFNTWVNINPEKTWDEYLSERPAAAVETLVATLVGGAIQVGGTHAAGRLARDKQQAADATAGMDTLQKISVLAVNNSVKKNDPEKFHEAIAHISDSTNLQEVYVDAATLETAFSEKGGKELLQKMPEVAAQLAEAKATQGDVRITLADYATHIAGSEFDAAILPQLKTSAGGITFDQSKAYAQTYQTNLKAQAEELAASSEPIMTRAEFDSAQQETKPTERRVTERGTRTSLSMPSMRKAQEIVPNNNTDPIPSADALAMMSRAEGALAAAAASPAPEQRSGERRAGGRRVDSNTRELLAKAQASGAYTEAQVQDVLKLARNQPVALREELGAARVQLALAEPTQQAAAKAKVAKLESQLAQHATLVENAIAPPPAQKQVKLPSAVFNVPKTGGTYEQYLAEHKNQAAVLAADVQKVHDAIFAGIKSTGRYSDTVAEGNALVMRAAYVQMAARAGIKPSELYAQKPLKFTATNPGGFAQFAGEKAKTADLFSLDAAKEMIAAGANTDKVREATGWHKGADGKWRFEISDSDAKLNIEGTFGQWWDAEVQHGVADVGSLVSHDKLFAAYPWLENFRIAPMPLAYAAKGVRAAYDRENNRILIAKTLSGHELLSSVMHEAQHAIQNTEQFASGGNPETVKGLLQYLDEGMSAKEAYARLAGEIEARNTQARLKMTEADRRSFSPDMTADRDAADAIVIFNGEASTFTPANAYAQLRQGSFDPETFTMAFLNSADLTTPVHEAGHMYLELLIHVASGPNAPKDVVADLAKTMAWFGVSQEQWAGMTLEQKRPYHEQWAENWERYGIEGVAPSSELRPVFARFSAWLTQAYKSVQEFVETHPAAGKLNDEMRAVFDRLLASREAIAEAEALRGYAPLFASAAEAKISEEEFLKYVNRGQNETEASVADMAQKSVADMKWLSGAKSKALRELQSKANTERAKIHAQVTAEVTAEPVYLARTELLKRDSEFKIHTGALKDLMPGLDTALLRGMLSTENGTHPDQLAERFGFSGGMVMVNEILAAENMKAKIDGITDQRMLEQHGELIDPRAIEQAANMAVASEGRARFMASGLKILEMKSKKDSPISATAMARAAKEAAYTAIAQKRIRDLRPAQYEAAETRSNLQAKKLAAKKPEGAVIAMRAALLNNRLAKAAYDAQDEAKKARTYLAKFQNASTRGNLDIGYVAQIDALMAPFDMSAHLSLKEIEARKSLDAFVQQQKALGFEPAINIDSITAAAKKSYKELTVSELRDLVDAVRGIEHLGRMKNKLLTAKDAREFKAYMDEAKASILEHSNRTVAERGTPTDVVGMFGQWGRSFTAEHRKFASIMREMDGGQDNGVMYQRFLRPMNDAGNKELTLRETFSADMTRLFKPVIATVGKDGRIISTKRQIPGTKISLTNEQRLSVLMNMGNVENQQRLLDGGIAGRSKPTMNDLARILDTFTKEELDWAQSIGDYYDSLRPMIEAQELALTGLKPKWIQVQPLVTKHGTYRGWYHPAKYDAMLSTRSESLEAAANVRGAMQGGFHPDSTRDSYIQDRAKSVSKRPLLLSFDVISQHLNEVAHRLAWQEYLTDAQRMVKALEDTIRERYGPEILQSLRKTLDHITVGNAPAHGATERALNYARIGTTIVGLGWRATTAMLQPTGLAQSWSRIGGPWIARGFAKYFKNPLEAGRLADAASSRMPHRAPTQSREIADMLNTLRAGDTAGRVTEAIRASRFYAIAKMQRVVDVITWHGANEKALAQLKYENAVTDAERADIEKQAADLADQGVIDSQGSGLIADMAPVQNGAPAMKLFTNFYSYFNTTYNLNVEAYRRTSFKSPAQVGLFAADMLVLNTLPVVLGVAIKNMLKGSCDWNDGECLSKKYGSEQIGYIAGQMLLLRELGTAFSMAAGGDNYGYQGPAGLRLITDTNRLVTDLAKKIPEFTQGEFDMDMKTFKHANQVAGAALHYPAGQINTTLDGIIAVEQGDVEGVSVIGALLAGPPK